MCEQAVGEQVRCLQVVEGPPVGGAQEGRDEGAEALEAALREVAPFNAGPLRLGVLQVGQRDALWRYHRCRVSHSQPAAHAQLGTLQVTGRP